MPPRFQENLPGRLIAVEGLDGSGESTQIALLKRWLEIEGYRVCFTEWNSSDLVKQATRRGKKQKLLTPTTFSLIHATDFADRYERQILPLLRAGFLVLADRYIYTAYARDAVRNVSREWLKKLYGFARQPDLTFYFDVPLATALGRILEGRPELKYHEAGMDLELHPDPQESFKIFQGKVYEQYQELRSEYNFIPINAELPPEEQQRCMREIVSRHIDLRAFSQKSASRVRLAEREGSGEAVIR